MNTLLQPDVCVPEDYRWTHRRKLPLQPEAALMLAVLEEAIFTFQKFAFSDSLRGKNSFREADWWIRAEDNHWPFSFNNICDQLGLDPAWIRMGLSRWKEETQARLTASKPAKVRRTAGNRFALFLGGKPSSSRMRVTALAIGPRIRVNARRVRKLSGGEHRGNNLGIATSLLQKTQRASNSRISSRRDAVDAFKINHGAS